MGASQAVGRDRTDARSPAPMTPRRARAELAADYAAEHLSADVAAREGFIDEVIEPSETRARLAWALSSLDRERSTATAVGTSRCEPRLRPAYVALGDSFTAGRRVPRASRAGRTSWPRRWAPPPAARVPQPRRGGRDQRATWTQASSSAALELHPDLVTLVCGANDVLYSVARTSTRYAAAPRADVHTPARARARGAP